MIRYVSGDLIRSATYGHRFDAIAHGVNCRGVMGSGIAKTIREQMPIVFRRYRELFEENRPLLGTVQAVPVREYEGRGGYGITVWNCATQEDYGRGGTYARLDAIMECLIKIRDCSGNFQLTPRPMEVPETGLLEPIQLGIPLIGAGLGGLTRSAVEEVFEEVFADSRTILVTVFRDFQPNMICDPWYFYESV